MKTEKGLDSIEYGCACESDAAIPSITHITGTEVGVLVFVRNGKKAFRHFVNGPCPTAMLSRLQSTAKTITGAIIQIIASSPHWLSSNGISEIPSSLRHSERLSDLLSGILIQGLNVNITTFFSRGYVIIIGSPN